MTTTEHKITPKGWVNTKVANYIKLQGGNAFSASNYVASGIPLVRIGNVGKGFFDNSSFVFVSKEEYEESKPFHLNDGDILMGMTGELGKVAKITKDFLPAVLNQRVGRIQFLNDKINREFVYQTFISPSFIKKLDQYFVGAAQKNISSSQVENIEICLPPIDEQSKIAEILSTIDKDISKINEIIFQTEKLKKGLMKEIFRNGHMVLLDTIAKRGSGHTPNKQHPEYWNGGIKWVSLADSSKLDNQYIFETDKEISLQGIEKSSAVLHTKNTVIVCRDAGIGKTAILGSDNMAVSQHFIAWQCGDELNFKYLYYWFQSQKNVLEQIATGTTIKTIGLSFFKKLQIPLFDIKKQQKIADTLSAIDEKISVNIHYKETLIELKKGLMYDLLSGSKRVKI